MRIGKNKDIVTITVRTDERDSILAVMSKKLNITFDHARGGFWIVNVEEDGKYSTGFNYTYLRDGAEDHRLAFRHVGTMRHSPVHKKYRAIADFGMTETIFETYEDKVFVMLPDLADRQPLYRRKPKTPKHVPAKSTSEERQELLADIGEKVRDQMDPTPTEDIVDVVVHGVTDAKSLSPIPTRQQILDATKVLNDAVKAYGDDIQVRTSKEPVFGDTMTIKVMLDASID